MQIKTHTPSTYKRYLQSVNDRIELSAYDAYELQQYEIGYQGEWLFFERLKSLNLCYIWDFQCKKKGWFQCDFLIFTPERIIHYDIKNFSGDYYYVKGNLIKKGTSVYVDSFSQLNRAHLKLTHLMNDYQQHYRIESKLLFINETFTLHQFVPHENIFFAHQLDEVMHYLNQLPKYRQKEVQFANRLKQLHINDHPKEMIHYYPMHQMSPGLRCVKCKKITVHMVGHYCVCKNCGHRIKKDLMFQHAFNELQLIKNEPLTCQDIVWFTRWNERTIQRYLKKYAHAIGVNKATKYDYLY